MLLEAGEEGLELIQVLLLVPAGQKNVINIHKDNGESLQGTIHQMLKHLANVEMFGPCCACQMASIRTPTVQTGW